MAVSRFVESLFRSTRFNRRRILGVHSHRSGVEHLEQRALLTLIGAEVTVSNLVRPAVSGDVAEPTQFGRSSFATVESRAEPEFVQFGDQYDINVEADTISLVNNLATNPVRPPNTSTLVDIYEFRIEGLASNEVVSSVTADTSQPLVPHVVMLGDGVFRAEIDPTQSTGQGFDALLHIVTTRLSPPLTGKDFSVQSTIQSNLGTGGIEIPDAPRVNATVQDGIEINAFGGQYDIDVRPESIVMIYDTVPTPGAAPSRILEPGTFERYYFDFDLLPSEFLNSAQVNSGSILKPVVTILDDNSLVVEIGPGSQVGLGFDATIDLEVGVRGSSVSGRVWQDLNNDGIQSGTEGWLNGFDFELRTPGGEVVARTRSRNIDLNNDGLINRSTETGIYLFEGVQTGQYTVAQLPRPRWEQTSPVAGAGSSPALVELRNRLGLINSPNEFLNYAGLQEKWILGADSTWFYITPDGTLTQWDGTSPRESLMGTVVANLSTDVYADLSLLYNAVPAADQTINVVSPNPVIGVDFGNYLPPPLSSEVTVNNADNSATFVWNGDELMPQGTMQVWIANVATRRRYEVTDRHTGTSYTATNIPDGRYRAWLRIEYSPGVFSDWTPAKEFELTRDAIVLPFTSGLDAGIDATPTVGWASVPDAVSYDIAVDDAHVNENNEVELIRVYEASSVVGISHRVAAPLALGSHQVIFRANFADGSRTEWSVPQSISVTGRPEVSVVGQVVRWEPVKAATEYEIWVDSIDDQGNRITRQIVSADGIQVESYTLPSLPRGKYSVWVQAIRAEAGLRHTSYWSRRVDFEVADVDAELNVRTPLADFEERLTVAVAAPDSRAETDVEKPGSDTLEVQENFDAKSQPPEQELLTNRIMEELASQSWLDDLMPADV